jgi:hypothetical protein
MRLVVGAVILWHAGPRLWNGAPLLMGTGYAVLVLGALLLIAGLWTPVAGVMVSAMALWNMLTGELFTGHLLAATIAGALAMLGPGRASVDARLFGWRRIDVDVRRDSSSELPATR